MMAADTSGGLHYSGDVTEAICGPQLAYSNPHGQRAGRQTGELEG